MTNRKCAEGEGRFPSFKGCRSFSYIAVIDGQKELRSGNGVLSAILHRAGRLVEIARTDGKDASVRIIDRRAMHICTIETEGM